MPLFCFGRHARYGGRHGTAGFALLALFFVAAPRADAADRRQGVAATVGPSLGYISFRHRYQREESAPNQLSLLDFEREEAAMAFGVHAGAMYKVVLSSSVALGPKLSAAYARGVETEFVLATAADEYSFRIRPTWFSIQPGFEVLLAKETLAFELAVGGGFVSSGLDDDPAGVEKGYALLFGGRGRLPRKSPVAGSVGGGFAVLDFNPLGLVFDRAFNATYAFVHLSLELESIGKPREPAR
jgi:hypothetical protein